MQSINNTFTDTFSGLITKDYKRQVSYEEGNTIFSGCAYIQSGGIYENKTVGVLVFRIVMTLSFTLFAYFTINKKTFI